MRNDDIRLFPFNGKLAAVVCVFAFACRAEALEISAPVEAPEMINPLRKMILKDQGTFLRLGDTWVDPVAERKIDGAIADLSAADMPVSDNLRVIQLHERRNWATLHQLQNDGFEVLGYLPDNAFVVRIPQRALAGVRARVGVRWLGNYAPEYRFSPRLRAAMQGRADGERWRVRVFFEDGREEIHETDAENIEALAAQPGVLALEYAPQPHLHNNEAAGILETRTMWVDRGLTGSNQIVAVADSGLDIGETNTTIHADFQDGAGHSRVIALLDTAGYGVSDANGHGTHVAGSVLGNGFLSGSNPTNNTYPTSSYAGSAPKARLVFQAIGSNTVSAVYPPDNLNDLLQPAYNLGARVHQNSWGSNVDGEYTQHARDADEFAFHHPELLIVFSAGNNGVDAEAPLGVVDPGSIGAPASAKNVIAVGATENNRPTFTTTYAAFGSGTTFPNTPISTDRVANAISGMAAFSSRGPALDGRIKPDIVAPGTFIASARSRAASSTGWGTLSNTNYIYNGGTSMSAPLVSGAAAVLREYLAMNHGLTNPPAALLKALLLHGAQDIAPGQYGDGAYLEIPARPSNVAGWGRLRAENDLFGDAGTSVHWINGWDHPLTNAATISTNITISSTNTPLRALLTWTDYHGSLFLLNTGRDDIGGGGLVNNLNLVLTSPSGSNILPLARNQNTALFYHTNRNSYSWYTTSQLYDAERCEAPELPLTLAYLHHLVHDTGASGGSIASFIWEDSGGVPGAVLFSETNSVGEGGGLWNLAIPVSVMITNSSFFIGTRHISGSNLRQIRDPGSSSRAFTRTTGAWSSNGGDLWIHVYGTTPTNDNVNNVLGAIVDNPEVGTWTISVSGAVVPRPPARFALVFSGALESSTNTPPGQVQLHSPTNCPDAGGDGDIGNDDFAAYGRLLNPRPVLIWHVPVDADDDPVHFKVYTDTLDASTLLANSSNSVIGFEYHDGNGWTAFPAAGAPTTNMGAMARYKPLSNLTAPTAHFWRVVAHDGDAEGESSGTNRFILGGRTWSDPELTGVTRMRKTYIDELHEEANYARIARLYPTQAWTQAITAHITPVRAIFFTELYEAIAEITNATGEVIPPYPSITPGVTPVNTNFVLELRRALEDI